MRHSSLAIFAALSALAPAQDVPRRGVMPKELANAQPVAESQLRVVCKLVEGRAELAAGGRVLAADVLGVAGDRPIAPFFRGLETQLAALRARQLAAAAPAQPPVDLALYFEIETRSAQDTRDLVRKLNALATVELAYARELPTPPPGDVPPFTPDFTAQQGFRAAAPNGVDASTMLWATGASGTGVRVLDIEWGWDFGHEDIAKLLATSLIGPAIANTGANNHGTAVGGLLAGDPDDHGVTGFTPDITLRVATDFPATGYSVANAIAAGLPALQSGDVMLLEAQIQTPLGLGPTEWVQADFDAIVIATNLGIVTVEAGGNGGVNLDDPALGGLFNTAVRDSGAIIVGASAGSALTAASFSAHGARIDSNGWGQGVVATGYGDLFTAGVLQNYTSVFGGTSSASTMVTGAAVALRGAAKAQLDPTAAAAVNAAAIRTLLRANGTAIPTIARRPDMRALLGAANVLRGLSVRDDPAIGQTCNLDLVPTFAGTGADLFALFASPLPQNLPLPAPFPASSRALLDTATLVPIHAGTFATTPQTYSIAIPLNPALRGQSFYFQALTLEGATNAFATSNSVRVFIRT